MFDSWLTAYYDDVLGPLDEACRRGESLDLGVLRTLDDDAWTLLTTKEYSVYPHLRAALPELPDPATQETWNGRSGVHLATQSASFLRTLKALYARYGQRPLAGSTVLDFGCGWGRLTRLVARDVAPGRLCACDPYPGILDVCERMRVPARLAPIAYVPTALPFDDRFDLVYAFSVFTHLSEETHLACLRTIHTGLADEGLLIATIRPPAYVREALPSSLSRRIAARRLERHKPSYLFAAHDDQPSGDQETYGETVLNLAYVRECWGAWFELLDVSLMLDDIHQVVLTLRGRPSS